MAGKIRAETRGYENDTRTAMEDGDESYEIAAGSPVAIVE
jgi:hypothetical protein